MNTRRAAIERMAEHDPFWRGYLAGMNDEHAVRAPDRPAEYAETIRLLEAKVARLADQVAEQSVFVTIDQARAKLAQHRALGSMQASRERADNWDQDWIKQAATPNAADLDAPRYT